MSTQMHILEVDLFFCSVKGQEATQGVTGVLTWSQTGSPSMITLFGYIHPIKLLYLLDTLHHIFRC